MEISTTTSSEAEESLRKYCTICKKTCGHWAIEHDLVFGDENGDYQMKGIYFDSNVIEIARDEFEYVIPEMNIFERLLIFLKLKKKLNPIKIKKSMFCELILKVKIK